MLFDIIIFIAVLAVLILAHEAGHFLAARRFGMLVEEFGIGFPPRLFSWKRGDTVWSINAIPLGGFVKIAGEDGEEDPPLRSFGEAGADQRGQESNELVGEHIAVAVAQGEEYTQAEAVVEKIYAPRSGAGGNGRFFSSKPIWQRATVLAAGVAMNFIIGWILFSAVFMIGAQSTVVVADIVPDSPAAQAGLRAGDIIIGFSDSDQFVGYINEHKGEELLFKVKRNGEEQTVAVTPRVDVPEGQGPMGVGVVSGGVERMPFLKALWAAVQASVGMFGLIFVMLFRLIASIFGGPNIIGNLSGPVGIFNATAQASSLGIVYILNLMAVISVNLAALNIFPFPALDGGRIVFLGIEKIRRAPVSTRVQQWVNAGGFFLLILLIIYITAQDIIKLF